MTRDIVLQLLEREPFKQLEVCLSNNDKITIDDPALAEVGRNYLVIRSADSSVARTITLHHVLYVDCENAPIEETH